MQVKGAFMFRACMGSQSHELRGHALPLLCLAFSRESFGNMHGGLMTALRPLLRRVRCKQRCIDVICPAAFRLLRQG